MLRAVLGCRLMKPACSSVSTIWCTEGGLTRNSPDLSFGEPPAVQARVEVYKRQILALPGCEGFCRATRSGHPIQLFVRASTRGGTDERTLGKSSATTADDTKRNGTAKQFVLLDVNRPWRKVKVTERRPAEDFAVCMRDLTDVHYPEAERIRVVLDNLSTHSAGALYQTFPADQARRVLRRLEFHYVPKHASWLNMVEIEIGVLVSQCLDRRIESYARFVVEIAAWEKRRNAECARANWMFTTEKARAKMGRAYPKPTLKSDHSQRVKTSVTRY